MKLSSLFAALLAVPLFQTDTAAFASSAKRVTPEKGIAMEIQSTYPIIVTDKLVACRDFYTRWFGYEVAFEASWFVYLASGANGIAFMSSDHPSQPPGPETFNGKGMFFTVQVADAEAAFKRLKQAGLPIAYPLRDEPWGQRRFGLVDPAGMWVDVVQQIEPQAGYWDKYMRR